jgi:hypothetical protein
LKQTFSVHVILSGFSPFRANALCDAQVHGDYAKEDVGVKMDRPAEGDEAMGGQEVAAAE